MFNQPIGIGRIVNTPVAAFFSGSLWDIELGVKLKDGTTVSSFIPLNEGFGSVIHNSFGGYFGDVSSSDIINFWETRAINIPASTTTPNKDSAGNDLEYLPDKTMVTDNPTQLKAPLYKPHINQEKDIGVNLWFDGAGGQNALTLSDLTSNWNDANFYAANKYLVYEAAITGSCKTKTETYMAG
jgi:hypothetical protein